MDLLIFRKPTVAMKIAQQLQDTELHLLDVQMAAEHFVGEVTKLQARVVRLRAQHKVAAGEEK